MRGAREVIMQSNAPKHAFDKRDKRFAFSWRAMSTRESDARLGSECGGVLTGAFGASGGIGRRAGFRIQYRKMCGFKSRLAHQCRVDLP